ncbi:MAG: TIGR04086 family membrane protein [Oscillospiraceae bacterium]|jgi:putative membrane protein (TIGR04086 family)|nr:TIGR04086 family membrane protein [Oscillospiraceae bacterium]
MKAHASSFGAVLGVLRGILAAVAVTVLGVVVFALAIQWFSLSNTVISILNQALKLAAIAVGARACVGRGGSNGIFKGALVGLVYMMLGIVAYAFLSGLSLQTSAYLADLGMGVAAGGLCGMILANMKKK